MVALPVLRVRTLHSEYLIDQNTATYSRTRRHDDANDLSPFGVEDGKPIAFSYRDFAGPVVGQSMRIIHANGTYVLSTPVVSIEEPSEAVA